MRYRWIDALRGIAVICVVLGHTMDIFPDNQIYILWQHLAFTIPWFVFLSGTTNALSILQKRPANLTISLISLVIRRILHLLPVYFIALFISIKFSPFPHITLAQFIREGIRFWTVPTFYFVQLILELYLLFPILYAIAVTLKRPVLVAISIVVVGWFAYFFPYFQTPNPYGGTNIIIGGGYLLVFYLGILYGIRPLKESRRFIVLVITGCILTDFVYITFSPFLGHSTLYFILLHGWSIPLLFAVKLLVKWLPKYAMSLVAFFGRQSLFIFLLHYTILWILNSITGQNIGFVMFLCIIIISIIVPLIIAMIYDRIIGIPLRIAKQLH
jgi:peptidoglycan/LPS O-acetylase OafA/YrhL